MCQGLVHKERQIQDKKANVQEKNLPKPQKHYTGMPVMPVTNSRSADTIENCIVANTVSLPTECCPNISEFKKRNCPGATRIKFIKGNHGFYNGAKAKKVEIFFLGRKINLHWSRLYQKILNSKIWGECFFFKIS